jgi:segregation and condensation protein B
MTLKQAIEALVFASPKPLLTKEILAALKSAGNETEDQNARDYAQVAEAEVLAALAELQTDYRDTGRSFLLTEQVNGWALVTDPGAAVWVRQLYPEAKPTRLSGPALETLAIIAYRQPVTRADIEAVRGVAVDGVMQVLLDRSLVKIAGRAEVPGRPLLYQTTEYFLQHFGLRPSMNCPTPVELKRVPLPTAPLPSEDAEKKPKGRKGKTARSSREPGSSCELRKTLSSRQSRRRGARSHRSRRRAAAAIESLGRSAGEQRLRTPGLRPHSIDGRDSPPKSRRTAIHVSS